MKRVLPLLAIAAVVLFFILNGDDVEPVTPVEPVTAEEPAPEVVARPHEDAASKPSVSDSAAPERTKRNTSSDMGFPCLWGIAGAAMGDQAYRTTSNLQNILDCKIVD